MDMVMDTDIIMKTMIDIHTHLIPGADDGSKTLEETKKIFLKYIDQGVKKIFLTPHVNSSVSKKSREYHREYFDVLKEISRSYGLELFLGAEIYLPFRLPDLDYSKYTLGNSNALLVEFSPYNESPILDHAYNLKKRGYDIIVAHVERYSYLEINQIRELKNIGIYIQVNASSLLKKGNVEYSKRAKKLLKENLVDFIATDCHGLIKRPPFLKEAFNFLCKFVGKEYAKDLVFYNQEKLLF